MIIDRNYDYYEDERLYSTGDYELDDLLERAFCEGYEYAQREFNSPEMKKINKELARDLGRRDYEKKREDTGPVWSPEKKWLDRGREMKKDPKSWEGILPHVNNIHDLINNKDYLLNNKGKKDPKALKVLTDKKQRKEYTKNFLGEKKVGAFLKDKRSSRLKEA